MQVPKNDNTAIVFKNDAHRAFYEKQTAMTKADCYTKALIYTLGICEDTRRSFDELYDAKDRSIMPEAIHAAWQNGGSMKVTRLAFQLFTDGTPSAFIDYDNPDVDECRKYSVSDIFCCEFAPYFVEAIRIRYPEYMTRERGAFAS